jgi:hypothetical protein
MREHTRRALGIALVGMSLAAVGGCNTVPQNCAKIDDIYLPAYTPVDGTCGTLTDVNRVKFDGGLHGVNTLMDYLGNAIVTTDIVMKGCTVHMTQKVQTAETHVLESQIDGESIRIESKDHLTGMVSVEKYDANGTLLCSGNYSASFTLPMMTTGGAVVGGGVAGATGN